MDFSAAFQAAGIVVGSLCPPTAFAVKMLSLDFQGAGTSVSGNGYLVMP